MSERLRIFTDGACVPNPGRGSWGIVIENAATGEHVESKSGVLPDRTTNNVAEITAMLEALKAAKALGAKWVELRSDSSLAIGVVSGKWKAKLPHIRKLRDEARILKASLGEVRFVQIPREENEAADELTRDALDMPAWPTDYRPSGLTCSRCRNDIPLGEESCLCPSCAGVFKEEPSWTRR